VSHISSRRRRCVLALTVAAVAATPFAAAPAAHATGDRTVTTSMSSAVHVAVHDPADALDWPGDTHELHVDVRDVDGPGTIDVVSFDCGPHDTARTPEDLGCPAVDQHRLDIREPAATVRNGAIHWRVATDAGPLRLRLTGSTRRPWVSDAWERAEGTRYVSGREVRTHYTGSAVTGTVAGLALTQPVTWREQSRSEGSRTVARVWRGPAVPLPVLPPVGAGEMGDESHGRASVTWVRPLPDGDRPVRPRLGGRRLRALGLRADGAGRRQPAALRRGRGATALG
jgi:hypothetical protein